MPDTYFHGVRVTEAESSSTPIQSVNASVIGIVGTAPDAIAEAKSSLTTGTAASDNGITWTAKADGTLGDAVSVALIDPAANSASLSIAVNGNAITVSLATDASGVITTTATALQTAIEADADAASLVTVADTGDSDGTGVVAAVAKTFLAGGVDEAFPLNTPVLINGSKLQASRLGKRGTLPPSIEGILNQIGALIVVVRVAEGVDDDATQTNVIGGTTAGVRSGVQALLDAESEVSYKPRILLATGWTHQKDGATANPVQAALAEVAGKLHAVAIADGDNTTDTAATDRAEDSASDRVEIIDPWVKMTYNGQTITWPASAARAGLIVSTDYNVGWWRSPSNLPLVGILGLGRPINFNDGDPTCNANVLNEGNVTTIIRRDGFRVWGNRCSNGSFLSIRRVKDVIGESVQRAILDANDRNIVATFADFVIDSVNNYLATLQSLGAIVGGRCWADPDLNTPANISQGKVYFNLDFGPAYPAEQIQITLSTNDAYLEGIF